MHTKQKSDSKRVILVYRINKQHAQKNTLGIIGLGNIAHQFAADIQLSDHAMLKGVASQSMEKVKSWMLSCLLGKN